MGGESTVLDGERPVKMGLANPHPALARCDRDYCARAGAQLPPTEDVHPAQVLD